MFSVLHGLADIFFKYYFSTLKTEYPRFAFLLAVHGCEVRPSRAGSAWSELAS
jgi:hypothetical protein